MRMFFFLEKIVFYLFYIYVQRLGATDPPWGDRQAVGQPGRGLAHSHGRAQEVGDVFKYRLPLVG